MVLRYLAANDALDSAVVTRTQRTLDAGYKKLTGYESESKGFEWFGQNPGHEALTAYGLMQFVEMAEVYPELDRAMVKRTQDWLKGRRDGQGGYQRNARALDTFGRASQDVTDAYITYALAKTGERDLHKELQKSRAQARASKDPYVLALSTGALLHADGKDRVTIASPRNIAQSFPLPAASAGGCVMASRDDFRSEKPEIALDVACTSAQTVIATAVLREALVGRIDARIPAGQPTLVTLPAPSGRQGAVRVTVFSSDRKPLAERLVYRGLGRHVQVQVEADRDSYSPRDKVELAIHTRGADGEPVAADIALAVVDDTVLDLADDKSASILAALYLQPEMPGQDIRDANFYFSADPNAPQALDHLLGTQGWRRFKWVWKARNP